MSCLLAMRNAVLLQDLASDLEAPTSVKPWMLLLLPLGSFVGLEAGQGQGLQACRVQQGK